MSDNTALYLEYYGRIVPDKNWGKNIESAKRNLYLRADSNCKSLLKLKEKKKVEHLKSEEKKEESELEDIIGSRFVFNQSI